METNKHILILGNGVSRIEKRDQINSWPGELWVCNWAFKEDFGIPIRRIGTVHAEVIKEAHRYRQYHKVKYEIWSKPELKRPEIDGYFLLKKGWATGNMMIAQAILEGNSDITLAGFDFGGKDIYQVNPLNGDNFRKQFETIKKMWPDTKISIL